MPFRLFSKYLRQDTIVRSGLKHSSFPPWSVNEKINFRKLSPDLCTIWLASITEGNSIYLKPFDLTVLSMMSDNFFDLI